MKLFCFRETWKYTFKPIFLMMSNTTMVVINVYNATNIHLVVSNKKALRVGT
jgi:hypothetical protein